MFEKIVRVVMGVDELDEPVFVASFYDDRQGVF